MEKKVMNKKFVATLALVLIVVVGLSAAPTFSGRFRQGYTFTFSDPVTITEWKTGSKEEAKLVFKFADENGLWTVDLRGTGAMNSNDKWAANASIDLGKALTAAGVDTGKVTAVASIGNNTAVTVLSAYNDVTGNEDYKFKNNGAASTSLTIGYDKLVKFQVAVDPTNADRSVAVAALTEPVDGVKAGIAYAYNATTDEGWNDTDAINGSVDVNIAKLADLDFSLGLSAFDTYLLDVQKNYLAVNVNGGAGDVSAYVEFTLYDTTKGLNTYVEYAGIENVGLDAYFNIADLSDVANNYTVGADVSYDLGGVSYNLNAEYGGTFSLTPYVVIYF